MSGVVGVCGGSYLNGCGVATVVLDIVEIVFIREWYCGDSCGYIWSCGCCNHGGGMCSGSCICG